MNFFYTSYDLTEWTEGAWKVIREEGFFSLPSCCMLCLTNEIHLAVSLPLTGSYIFFTQSNWLVTQGLYERMYDVWASPESSHIEKSSLEISLWRTQRYLHLGRYPVVFYCFYSLSQTDSVGLNCAEWCSLSYSKNQQQFFSFSCFFVQGIVGLLADCTLVGSLPFLCSRWDCPGQSWSSVLFSPFLNDDMK